MTKPKVIIWGHQLSEGHTHSFIHNAFYRAFNHLSYETSWLDNNNYQQYNFSDNENYLFLTEGQVDQNIPILKNAKYVLHNCNLNKYQLVLPNTLNIQVYTKRARNNQEKRKLVYLDKPCHWYQPNPVLDDPQHGIDNRTLYFIWGTNLLPDEFPEPMLDFTGVSDTVYWVGSICGGYHGNDVELNKFIQGCTEHNIKFQHLKIPEGKPTIKAIRTSYVAPALQGKWQVENEYIPCRVFKNISYGRIPATNNLAVAKLFSDQIPYVKNCENICEVNWNQEQLFDGKLNNIKDLQEQVRQNHTYINRIKSIMEVL